MIEWLNFNPPKLWGKSKSGGIRMMYPQNIGNDYILVNTPTFLIPQNFGNWKTTLFLSDHFTKQKHSKDQKMPENVPDKTCENVNLYFHVLNFLLRDQLEFKKKSSGSVRLDAHPYHSLNVQQHQVFFRNWLIFILLKDGSYSSLYSWFKAIFTERSFSWTQLLIQYYVPFYTGKKGFETVFPNCFV